MTALKRVLVAVDGSESGYRAAEFATDLASALQSKLIGIYVIGASSSMPDYQIPADMVEAFEDIGNEALAKCKARAESRKVEFESSIVFGDPAEQIMKSARDYGCDCIVLGRRGLGNLERLLMGSVSDKVSKLSDLPVILIK